MSSRHVPLCFAPSLSLACTTIKYLVVLRILYKSPTTGVLSRAPRVGLADSIVLGSWEYVSASAKKRCDSHIWLRSPSRLDAVVLFTLIHPSAAKASSFRLARLRCAVLLLLLIVIGIICNIPNCLSDAGPRWGPMRLET